MRRRLGIGLVVVALAACGGGDGGGSGDDDAAPTTGPPVEVDGDALLEQAEAAATAFQAALVERTGLDGDGVGAVAEELAAVADAAIATVRTDVEAAPIRPRRIQQFDGVSSSSGLMAGVTTAGLAVAAVLDGSNGGQALSGTSGSTTVDVSAGRVAVEMGITGSSGGVDGSVHVSAEVSPCPDAAGEVEAHLEITVSLSSSQGGGGTLGSGTTITAAVRGTANDHADLDGYDVDGTVAVADAGTVSGGGETATTGAAISGTFGVGVSGLAGAGDPVIDRIAPVEITSSSGSVDDAYESSFSSMIDVVLQQVATNVMRQAERAWQSGRCVELEPTVSDGPSGLDPSATVTITAAPRSRIDGGSTGGTVAATLASGGASVEPAGDAVPADAEFTYTAPDERDQEGSVALEARSRRGVGRATLALDTRAGGFVVTGDINGIAVTGTKCDGVAGDWVLSLSGANSGVVVSGTFTATLGPDGSGPVVGGVHGDLNGGQLTVDTSVAGSGALTLAEDGSGTLALGPFQSDAQGQAGGFGFGSSMQSAVFTMSVAPAPAGIC